MRNRRRLRWDRWRRAALALALGAGAGCNAALGSSNSVSEGLGSVSSVSESLADSGSSLASSSSDGAHSAALERDATTYTALFLAGPEGDPDAFLRGLGELCRGHAVTHWERDPAVLRGIAAGLAAAEVAPSDFDRFVAEVAAGDGRVREGLLPALREVLLPAVSAGSGPADGAGR